MASAIAAAEAADRQQQRGEASLNRQAGNCAPRRRTAREATLAAVTVDIRLEGGGA
jgi:hypothetical protein